MAAAFACSGLSQKHCVCPGSPFAGLTNSPRHFRGHSWGKVSLTGHIKSVPKVDINQKWYFQGRITESQKCLLKWNLSSEEDYDQCLVDSHLHASLRVFIAQRTVTVLEHYCNQLDRLTAKTIVKKCSAIDQQTTIQFFIMITQGEIAGLCKITQIWLRHSNHPLFSRSLLLSHSLILLLIISFNPDGLTFMLNHSPDEMANS